MFKRLFKLKNDGLSEFKNSSENKFIITDNSKNEYGVSYIPFETEDKVMYGGIYKVFNAKGHKIGELKYIYYYDKEPPYVVLGDIHFEPKYRNAGLGTKLINAFEERAKSIGTKYIEGELSSVDEDENNKELRNNFYINRGYEIIDAAKIVKFL